MKKPKSKTDMAAALGVCRATLYQWKDKGLDLDDWPAVLAWAENQDAKQITDEEVKEARKATIKAKAKKEQADARLKQLKYEKELGKLVEIEEVRETLTMIGSRVRNKIMSLAGQLPSRVAGMKPEDMEAIFERDFTRVLEELAKELNDIENE